jgi:hypothetical protein
MKTTLDDPLVPSSARFVPAHPAPPSPSRLRRESFIPQPTDPVIAPVGTEALHLARLSKPVPSREDPFGVMLWCTGTVRAIDRANGIFQADLVDDKGTRSSADISVEDVDPSERRFLVEGNRFTYVVFHERRASGLVNADEIVMEPTPTWTADDVEHFQKGPSEDLTFLDADD